MNVSHRDHTAGRSTNHIKSIQSPYININNKNYSGTQVNLSWKILVEL